MSTMLVPLKIADCEVTLEVEYLYSSGRPARGPSYSSGGEPEEPPEVAYGIISVGQEPVPTWLFDLICESDEVYNYILDHHPVEEDPGPPDEE